MDFNKIPAFAGMTEKNSFIFRNGRVPATVAGATAPDEEEAEAALREQQERQRERQRDRQAMQSEVARAPVNPETKQRMRECLASENLERQNLVERLLRKEITQEKFLETLDLFEREDESWKTIFATQREVRKRIQELQYRAESYIELIPHKKDVFDAVLQNARGLNKQDDATDRSLKRELHALTAGNPQQNQPPTLNAEEANEIYQVDPLSVGYEKTLKKYQSRIEAAPNGKSIFRKLVAFKKEEAKIERQFNELYTQFDKIIQHNLSQVRRKAQREQILKTASKAVGITIREGTVLQFTDPGILAVGEREGKVKIARITWEEVNVRDRNGKVIDRVPGIPFITLVNGSEKAKIPLGRFKKWVDAVDAVEAVGSLADAEEKTGLKAYGIKIEKGMEFSYTRRTRDEQGRVTATPVNVRITNIKDGRIHLDKPVLFAPGLDYLDQSEDRDSLTFGEFVKWWHRYEVEKSIGLEELRKLLGIFNEMDNKQFGIEPKDNPPILVKEYEELKYPDEGGAKFRIAKVDTDGVTLDNGIKYSFPEFFYWVKNNNVEKVPERKRTPPEQEEERKRQHEIGEARGSEEKALELERNTGAEQLKKTVAFYKEREAGSLIENLKQMWWTTQFISLKDLWNMTLEIVEFVKRKHQRRSKGRYGEVGSRLPWVLGPEFERVKQAAENEEVNKYKEAMEHWSVEKVKRTLHETSSKDIAKACIMTLLHHGEMRWDDHDFWKTLNRLTAHYTLKGASLYIPPPEHIPPGKSGEDMTVPAIDALWGEGQASQWIQENISKYNSNKNNFEYIFKQTENDPKGTGGPAGRCRDLLATWVAGGYVNPQEYEEMIDAAIKYGKMSAEGKMFYMIAGVLARQGNKDGKNPHGETLLHLDRLGEIDSKYLNQFPILDFFTTKHVYDPTLDPSTNQLRKPNRLSDYARWMEDYFPNDFKKGEPAAEFSRFMWEVIMPNEEVRTRMSKGIRNAENMDHDDAHLNIPPLTPTEIDNVTTGPTGQKKYFTNEGYMNGYPGFNHYILSLSYILEEEIDEKKRQNYLYALRDTVNGFIRYDAILDNRFKRGEKDHRARLDDRHYKRKTVVGGNILCGEYQAQLRNVVMEIGKAYGEDFSWLYGKKFGLDEDGEKRQKEYETKIEILKDRIADLIQSDNGAKAIEAIKRARALAAGNEADPKALSGIPDSRRPPQEAMERLRRNAREERLKMAQGGHGGH